jgi:two-component system, chemotaxis family, sensor kinase CheA
MNRILQALILPSEITDFERSYVQRVNRVGLAFYALHVPVFVALAYFNETGPMSALVLTTLVLLGPAVAFKTLRNPRAIANVYGVTAMLMGGLLVHFGRGPVQIEMHFYFFALLAMLAVYGNPLVILAAAATVALHHLLGWWLIPSSVFNYDAPLWVVAVHAGFVVLESVATCTIARSFFDNVIGLEKVVQARTAALDTRNRDMRLVLDNVEQGFLTVDRDGMIGPEYSKIVEDWFGVPKEGTRFADYLSDVNGVVAKMFELGWVEVVDGIMPLDVTLDQLPSALVHQHRQFSLAYSPILREGELERVLLVITDQTATVAKERLEAEQREAMVIFDRILRDKTGFVEFFEEANEFVDLVVKDEISEKAVLKRVLHTLKGNSMIFGINTVADVCHAMESAIEEEEAWPSEAHRNLLRDRWVRLRKSLETLLGEGHGKRLEIDDTEYSKLLQAVLKGAPHKQLAQMMGDWQLEPTAKRLARLAEQAQGLARRLNKGPLQVNIDAGELRLEPQRWASFWSAFVHVLRNAIDHGLEEAHERQQANKPNTLSLRLSTRCENGQFVLQVEDDGRGIDWGKVAAKAAEIGILTQDQHELEAVLFHDGISTRDEANEFSGRGVGLGAVKAASEERMGRVEVHSAEGKGTRITFRFPEDQMAGDIIARYRAA